jgi:hypothetical protein
MRRAALVLLAALALAGCRESAAPAPEPLLPDLLEQATRDCTRQGGRMVSGGFAGAMTCQRDMPDAGRQCTKAGDCQGDCLARSGTCAPVSPLFGCNEILLANGQRATLCRD